MISCCPTHGYYQPIPGTTIAQCPSCASARQPQVGTVVIHPPSEERIRQIIREELERVREKT